MSFIKTTIKTSLLFSILTAFVSCNGQNHKPEEFKKQSATTINIGDTVSEIGKNIRCIFQDSENNFWFASDGEGLFRYDGITILQLTEKNGLCGDFVRLIQQDKEGTKLVSTGNSICLFDGKQFRTLQSAGSSLNPTNVSTLLLSYVNYYQDKSLNKFQIPQTSNLTKTYSQNSYAVYCSYRDRKGNIWFGTESRGVCKYDGKTFTWFDDKELGAAVRSIFEDSKGNIWIGNNGYGLFRYDGKTLTNFTKEHKLDNPDFQITLKSKEGTLARVWAITEDKQGNLWIGTADAGLWKYDDKVLMNYTIKAGSQVTQLRQFIVIPTEIYG